MTDEPLTVRTVIPHAHIAPRCMHPVTRHHPCCLLRGHRDRHLPMPHFPVQDISDDNPAWTEVAA